MKNLFLALLVVLSGVSCVTGVQAATLSANYPNKPIRLIVPSPPGGSNDGVARIVANELNRSLGQSIIVDNRAGAGGVIAADLVANSTPDGYTVLFAYATFTTAPFLNAKLPYDPINDFSPITEIANQPLLLVANPSLQANTVGELVALANSRKGGLAAGFTQIGSSTHLTTEIFKQRTHTTKTILGVSYKGGGAAQIALLSGEVQISFTTVTAAMPQVKAGRIKVIATTARERLSYLPNVPTFVEAGVQGLEVAPWQGLMVVKGTPREIIVKLHSEVVKLLKIRDARERLAALGAVPIGSSPEEFSKKIEIEIQESGKLIKALGLKL